MKNYIPLAVLFFLLISCNSSNKFPGYTLIEKRFVEEVNADCYYLEHNKSGAKIFKIAASDPNKAFSISFKTLPENNCGTPHILEHSVLNGSKNFPVKSPFDVLVKGSLNTFLNAMTSKDRTMYPAASMNEKDYFNLMHVYYDAVFNPLIYSDPKILEQEGWHHELTNSNEDVIYKGVVYNEMKGAFSNSEREMYYQANKHLFPNNIYRFTSGGYPDSIPNLTYESFVAFHEKYYHPSNSFIFFYGNANMRDELTFIDTAYLSNYERNNETHEVSLHAPFDEMKEVTEYYAIPEGTDIDKQTNMTLNFVIGDGTDESLGMALDILTDILVNQESAPVRLALQEAGLGSNVEAWTYALRQHFVQISISNINPEEKDTINEIIFSTLEKAVEDGLDKESLEGIINRMEFRLREGDDAHKGVRYASQHIGTWIHSGNPFSGIEYEKPLAEVKAGLANNYFEQMVQKHLIDNNYKLLLVLEPKPGLEKVKSERITEKLKSFKNTLTEHEIDSLIKATESLLVLQEEEDSPEALATIPSLNISDVDPKTEWYEAAQKEIAGNSIFHYNEFTNSILYSHFLFDLRVLPEEMIPQMKLYSELLGKLDTENYTYAELEKALKIHTGGFGTVLSSHLDSRNDYELIPQFKVSAKATMEKSGKLFEFTEEVLLRTSFDDTARIHKVLTKHHAAIEAEIKNYGFGYTRKRLASYHSKLGLFNEKTSGIEYYWFLSDLLDNYQERAALLVNSLEIISKTLLTKTNLDCGLICTNEEYATLEKPLSNLFNAFTSLENELQTWQLIPEAKNEGFMTASKVQYVLQGANYFDLGYKYSGKLAVLNKIVNSDWLQKEVRIKGGAYGGFSYFLPNGSVLFGSYRDPNLTETLEAFAGTLEFLKNYETDSTEMVRSIIGTIARIDYPLTMSQKGTKAINHFYNGRTREDAQQERDEVLSVTIEDIRALETMVTEVIEENTYCVYGSQEKVNENKALFKSVLKIME